MRRIAGLPAQPAAVEGRPGKVAAAQCRDAGEREQAPHIEVALGPALGRAAFGALGAGASGAASAAPVPDSGGASRAGGTGTSSTATLITPGSSRSFT